MQANGAAEAKRLKSSTMSPCSFKRALIPADPCANRVPFLCRPASQDVQDEGAAEAKRLYFMTVSPYDPRKRSGMSGTSVSGANSSAPDSDFIEGLEVCAGQAILYCCTGTGTGCKYSFGQGVLPNSSAPDSDFMKGLKVCAGLSVLYCLFL